LEKASSAAKTIASLEEQMKTRQAQTDLVEQKLKAETLALSKFVMAKEEGTRYTSYASHKQCHDYFWYELGNISFEKRQSSERGTSTAGQPPRV